MRDGIYQTVRIFFSKKFFHLFFWIRSRRAAADNTAWRSKRGKDQENDQEKDRKKKENFGFVENRYVDHPCYFLG